MSHMKAVGPQNLKVVHLVAGDLSGGAARGAYWLHQALKSLAVESSIICSGKSNLDDPSVVLIGQSTWQKLIWAVVARLDRLPLRLYPKRLNRIFSTGFFGLNYREHHLFMNADVVHLHWINGLVSTATLRGISKPIVWTLRDMWPMTGGCHYSMGCERYQIGCGKCPQLLSRKERDLSQFINWGKRTKLPRHIRVIGISNWLSECARKSSIFAGYSIETISNGIDVKQFQAIDQSVARQALGLPAHRQIILAGAQNPTDFYKGFDLLMAALKQLDLSNSQVVLFGNGNPGEIAWLGEKCTNLGFLTDAVSLRLAYSAADVFVAPSREEAFGKTLAEALACGTPVVTFNATGPADIVEHKVNGYKAEPFDADDLAAGVLWLLAHDREQQQLIRAHARQSAEHSFDVRQIAREYLRVYEDAMQERDGGGVEKR